MAVLPARPYRPRDKAVNASPKIHPPDTVTAFQRRTFGRLSLRYLTLARVSLGPGWRVPAAGRNAGSISTTMAWIQQATYAARTTRGPRCHSKIDADWLPVAGIASQGWRAGSIARCRSTIRPHRVLKPPRSAWVSEVDFDFKVPEIDPQVSPAVFPGAGSIPVTRWALAAPDGTSRWTVWQRSMKLSSAAIGSRRTPGS